MSAIIFDKVAKLFPEGGGVKGFECAIDEGEFFALLGPSGCGKTTLLRLLAGLETPDSGRICIGGCDMTGVPPEKRGAAMVFQSYALFPHMNVFENVAFGLRARKTPKISLREMVREALHLVKMDEFERRHVGDLSGGQQQRIALARALAIRPAILLLDEPLSNLDADLRRHTREQLAELQAALGITTLYVTHDQEEALALAGRMAILREGECLQIGTPAEVMANPATPFVAKFLGKG